VIETIKVSSRGQIVIPERIRNNLDIKEGSKLILIEEKKGILLEKESDFMKKINKVDKEKIGWLALAEKSTMKMWDNKKDDKTWSKYV